MEDNDRRGRLLGKRLVSGNGKVAKTRTLESVRYVAQAFLPAGSRNFPVPFYRPDKNFN